MRAPRHAQQTAATFSLLLLLVAAVACETPIRVTTDRDPDADFGGFRSYAWISEEPLIPQVSGRTVGPPVSPIDDQRIRDAVDGELAARGWKLADSLEQADLVVSYGLGSQQRTEIIETPTGGWYSHRGYRYGGWYSTSTVRTRQVVEGTLTLEFFERKTRQAVWVGWASKRLSSSGTPDREATIRTAIGKILAAFPGPGGAPPEGDG